MKLKALDQIHVSSVQADSLRKGQEFRVSDALGAELLKRHPTTFEQLADDEADADAYAGEKAAPEPLNKAEPAPPNKAASRPRKKPAGSPAAKKAPPKG